MKFKIDSGVMRIVSPIVLIIDGQEQRFENGAALADYEFDKRYSIESISAKGDIIYLSAKEGVSSPSSDWTKEKVSFF